MLFMSTLKMNLSQVLPFDLLRKMAGVNPLIVNYHVVSDRKIPHIINLYKYRDIKTFKEDLDFFSSNFHPISLLELLDYVKNGSTLPENSFLLTFDDGFKEIYEIAAPLLLEKRIPATFFITWDYIDNISLGFDGKKSLIMDGILTSSNLSDRLKGIMDFADTQELVTAIFNIPYSDRSRIDTIANQLNIDFLDYLKTASPYLTSNQITHLIQEGFSIGSHALDHANFRELTLDDQIHQTISSANQISERFSLKYKVFAFPYSDNGISRAFFTRINTSMDATFGNQGLMTDSVRNHYQRISVEKSEFSAEKTTKFYYSRKLLKILFNRNSVQRY